MSEKIRKELIGLSLFAGLSLFGTGMAKAQTNSSEPQTVSTQTISKKYTHTI